MLIRILYTLLLSLAAPLLLYGLYKTKPGKPAFGSRWKEHFGITPKAKGQRPIWIHTVSVGESIAAIPVVKAIKAQYPDQAIVMTTTTSTGAEQVAKLGELVEHRYMPIDFAWCVRGFLRAVNPSMLLIMETELWPNTFNTVGKAGLPIVVMNARLSARSAERYQHFQSVFNLLSKHLTKVLCLHNDDAERFIQLGVPADKVEVTGSVKYDISIDESIITKAATLREHLGAERPTWVAASTHKGEDEQILDAFSQVKKQHPDSLLIIVPRHPERFSQVAELCAERGFNCVRHTSNEEVDTTTDIYLGDTMGEMLILQGAADITVMCGSFIGNKVGGHNLLEPAALAKPALTGPSYFNFTDITEQLVNAKAIEVCLNSEELATRLNVLLGDNDTLASMGEAALGVVKANQGAVAKTLNTLKPWLK